MNGIERPESKPLVPTFVLVLIALLAILALPGILFAWLTNNRAQRAEALLIPIRQVGNNEQEIIVSTDRVTLYVPEDATDLSGNFVISPRLPNLYSFASEPDWTRPVVVDIEYRNEDGVSHPEVAFSMPVSVCFAMVPEQWNDLTERQADFQVQFYDNEQFPSRWISLPLSMDPERYELCGQADHLSIFALAMKPAEAIPITGPTFTPTATPSPAVTVFNTQVSNRNQDSESPTPVPSATKTSPPQPTNTLVLRPTNMPLPTNTPRPTNTQTAQPTNTSVPATNTHRPPPTNTPIPPTNTPIPPTNTPIPVDTNTPVPVDTNTPVPADTNTPVPVDTPAALETLIEGVLSSLGLD